MGAVAGVDAWFEVLSGHALGLRALVEQAAPTGRSGRRSNVDAAKTARRADLMLEDVERLIDDTNEGALRGSPWVAALVRGSVERRRRAFGARTRARGCAPPRRGPRSVPRSTRRRVGCAKPKRASRAG